MPDDTKQKAKECCTREYDRLVDELDVCDDESNTSAERHRCYRIAARKSGDRSRNCIDRAE